MDICNSKFWDSNLTWYTDDPDFTPCFQKSVLALAAPLFLMIVGPIRMCLLWNRNKDTIPWNWLHTSKMCVIVSLIAFEVFTCAYDLTTTADERISAILFLSPLGAATGFIMALLLVLLERRRGVKTSACMFIFWLLCVEMAIVRLRSVLKDAFKSANPSPSIFVHYPLLICGFLLNLFADSKPSPETYQDNENKLCPIDDASFLSKITYWWCNGLVLKALKRPLTQADIWPLEEECKSGYVSSQYYRRQGSEGSEYSAPCIDDQCFIYENGTLTHSSYNVKKRKQRHFKFTLALVYYQPFLWGALIKLCHIFLVFTYPQILRLLIRFVSTDEYEWRGYFYSSAILIIALLESVLLHQYFHVNLLLGMRLRSTIISIIYRKSLKLSSRARKSTTIGKIINLMSIDAQRFLSLISNIHLVWSGTLQIAIAFYFLWQILGPSASSGLLVIVVLMPINIFITNREKIYQEKQMKFKDSRIKMMNEILSGIKVLKLYAWENFFMKRVGMARNNELKMLRKGIFLKAMNTCIWDMASFVMSLVSFAVYVKSSPDNALDPETAFVTLVLYNIMRYPLRTIPTIINNLVQAKVSWRRIQSFLYQDELTEYVLHKREINGNAITIENGRFGWDEESQKLSNINIDIKKGSLIAIVGSVGSGKSSLLYAILGEMIKNGGSVIINGSISFVAQEAWIQNNTFQSNIIFNSLPYKSKYDSIVDICALKPDLDILPSGNLTEIGEKGINLSGGQKQRVCLARAVYKDTDIYLLDDPLSAVDAQVGKHLFDNVIGPRGILHGKTRILVTNGVEFLPQVDEIILLHEGKIIEKGPFTELIENDGVFAEYVSNHLNVENDNQEIWIEEEESGTKKEDLLSLIKTVGKRRNSSGSKWQAFKRRRSTLLCIEERELLNAEKVSKNAKLVKKEKVEIGLVKSSVILAYLKAVGPFFSLLSILGYVISSVASIGSTLWLSDWSDENQSTNVTLTDANRNMRLGVYAALVFAQGLVVFITSLVFLLGASKATQILHAGLLDGVLHAPMKFFDTTPCGRILNRFSKDINTLDVIFPANASLFLVKFFSALGTLSIIGYSTPMFLIVVAPLFVFYCFIQRCYVASSRQLKRIESVTWSPIYSHFEETLVGAESIRAFNQEKKYVQDMQMKVDTNQSCHFASITCNRWLAIRLELVGHCIIFFACLFAVIGRKDLSPGIVGLSISHALNITQILTFLVRSLCSVETNYVAVERVKEYTDTRSEAPWIIDYEKTPDDWPTEGVVEFRDYETFYRDGLDSVLKGISFSIDAKEKIGIVGRTGSGKSSLMLALFRIIEAARGSILVDGVDISRIGLHDLRSRLTVIPQDPVLFSGTLRENIDPFGSHSDEELWSTLEHAHLKTFISSMPEGLDFKCLEQGGNLSVGQRQLVCLARAFLRRTRILILDEATASVDLDTDDLIQASIRDNFEDCTVLTIAHRLNTIMDYTRIIVLDAGNVKEFDSPQVLLRNKTSTFYGLAKAAGLV